MEILKEDIEDMSEWKGLLDLARAFRYLAILVTVTALIVLPFLQLFATTGPLSALFLTVILLAFLPLLARRRKIPAPYTYVPPAAVTPVYGQELMAIDVVQDQLRKQGVRDISREVVLQGALTLHRPDLLFKIDGEIYMAEVKVRPIVPSDIDNASRILQDVRFKRRDIHGVLLFSSIDPPSSVMEMARSRHIDIRVVPELEFTRHRKRL